MKKKLLLIGPVLLIVIAVAGYEFVMPKKAAAKAHLVGDVVNLPGQFTLNLAGGHYATLTVALLLPTAVKGGPADVPVIRAIITDAVTGKPEAMLIDPRGRTLLARRILSAINHQTNAVVDHVYFTDLAVQ
jgi:flagellar basal body-associated protein FliL